MSWGQVKLEDLFDIVRGGSPRPIDAYITEDQDSYNWISIKDASNSEKYIEKTKLKIKKEGLKKSRLVKPGDFLLTNSMSFGRPYIMKTTGCIHDGWLALSGDPSRVNQDYFYHLLSSQFIHSKFSSLAAGAVVKNLNINLVKGVEIPLPYPDDPEKSLKEQKRIAKILDKADGIRRKRQQAIELADEFLRSVFLDMFGDPVTNPKGWVLKACKDVCRQITVGLVIKPASYYVESGVPAIRSLNVKETGIKQEDFVYFSKTDNETKLAKSRVFEGDLVIVRSGQPGKTAVIPKELDGVNAIDVLIVRPDYDYLLSEFLAYFLNSSGGRNIVMAEERGQIQKHLNVGALNTALIPIPPIKLQKKFLTILTSIRKVASSEYLKDKDQLFNSLSQKAFKGEL